jgi:GNAT superfamily N-acetyltransferase
MIKTIPVVAYDRDQHEPALKKFTAKVLGADISERRQQVIDTFHERMPGRERVPLRHVLLDGDVVAGTLGYMPTDFLVDGARVAARYTHDLLVDPEYRGGGLGKLIVAHARELGDFYPGGMWMTGQCHKIHQQVGFDDVANLVTHTAVLDPASFAARRGFSPLKSIATRTGLGATRWVAQRRASSILSRAENSLGEVREMDPAHDAAWLDLAKGYGITRVRDAAYINWKYAGHPRLKYRIVMATRNGSASGFMVWRAAPENVTETRAVIADFLVAKGDDRTLLELVARVLRDAAAAGSDAVAFISTQSFATAPLQKLGFVAGGSRNSWVVANWKGVFPPEWLTDLERWHMTLGDSDGDIWTGSM